jgi:hypothetical protein
LEIEQKHDFFLKLAKNYKLKEFQDNEKFVFFSNPNSKSTIFYNLLIFSENNTSFTVVSNNNKISMKSSRPALIVSSSSWTEDEDFHILIESLQSKHK